MAIYGLYVFALVVGLFLLSLLAVGLLLITLPATYFLESHVRELWVDHHPVVRVLLHVVKNLVGLGVVVAGLVLLVTGIPGQAVVTLLLGVMLLDFPGKTRLERKLVSYPWLLQRVNRLRGRFDRPPLVIDETPPMMVSPGRRTTESPLESRGEPTPAGSLTGSNPDRHLV
jgi:hypothetical protein